MTLDIHNWSSTAHQEIHKIIKDEIFPLVNQVDARLQNFKIQFLKEAAKFVRDFKSLAKEADESLAKHKVLEFEIKRLLRAVVSQDIMSIVQGNSIVDTSNLQTELDRTKEKLENCIIKKEKEYVVLWNNWYTKRKECKYDKILYNKAYNDMQQKIERLQAQLEISRVLNYAKENAHLKTTYKNLFDSINMTWAQTKTITDSLQQKLHNMIYENAKLRAQLFDKVFEQKDFTKGTSVNTKFANQSTKRKPSLQSLRNNFVVRQPNAFQSECQKLSKTQVPLKELTTLLRPEGHNLGGNKKNDRVPSALYQPKGAAAATLGCVWRAAAAIRERLAVRQPWGAIGLCFRRIRVRLAVRQPWGAVGLCHSTRKGCLAVGTAMGPFGSRVCTKGALGLGIAPR
ncbi:hypothetical protein Tco_0966432 [Tanacetum coccineum]